MDVRRWEECLYAISLNRQKVNYRVTERKWPVRNARDRWHCCTLKSRVLALISEFVVSIEREEDKCW